jgi:rod shape-determining protein MreD
MRERFYLYVFILFSVLLQVYALRHMPVFPDIILLVVVFSGIFFGRLEGALAGLAAGFLRGCLSVGTLPVDLVVFPLAGYASSVLSSFFYRRNPAFQIFAASAGIFLVVSFHTMYFNAAGASLSMPHVFLKSWKTLAATVLLSPFIFAILVTLLRLEE